MTLTTPVSLGSRRPGGASTVSQLSMPCSQPPAEVIERFTDHLHVGTIVTVDGIVVSCDDRFAKSIGFSIEELIGKPAEQIVAVTDQPIVREHVRAHDTTWYPLNLVSQRGHVLPVMVVPSEFELNGQSIRTSVLLHRAPLEGTEARMRSAFKSAIAALSSAIETRDPYTHGHQARVADICGLICIEMGFDDDFRMDVELGAAIHDIGKISIPSEILVKPGKLSEAEWALMKTHTLIGSEIVADLDASQEVKNLVRHHHERLDGSGYPDGLRGREISLGTRILSIADALDAISGIRPYHDRRTVADAIAILDQSPGSVDQDVMKAVRSLHKRGALDGREFNGFGH